MFSPTYKVALVKELHRVTPPVLARCYSLLHLEIENEQCSQLGLNNVKMLIPALAAQYQTDDILGTKADIKTKADR